MEAAINAARERLDTSEESRHLKKPAEVFAAAVVIRSER